MIKIANSLAGSFVASPQTNLPMNNAVLKKFDENFAFFIWQFLTWRCLACMDMEVSLYISARLLSDFKTLTFKQELLKRFKLFIDYAVQELIITWQLSK